MKGAQGMCYHWNSLCGFWKYLLLHNSVGLKTLKCTFLAKSVVLGAAGLWLCCEPRKGYRNSLFPGASMCASVQIQMQRNGRARTTGSTADKP